MNTKLTLKRLNALAPLVWSLAVVAVGLVTIPRQQAPISQQQMPERHAEELQRRAGELQAILAALRTTDSPDRFWDASRRFEGWMARNVVRSRTTEADIVSCFGKDFQNLDRPQRDDIRTIEYLLYGDWRSGGSNVVFDFNSRSAILQDWHSSHWVCGFCPHVLADDGGWRLEGKMLAGRLGMHREGSDTLLLPRLMPQNQRLGIRLANWAGEMEYIDRVQLGVVPCTPGCEVDVDGQGQPYVWKERGAVELAPIQEGGGRDGWMLHLGEPAVGRVLVLEGRNAGEFERVMRKAVFRPGTPWPPASLALRFDDGACRELQPVGTKFLRRFVVPVPPSARTLRISALAEMWLVRRAWIGHGHMAQDVAWLSATEASGVGADALGLLRNRDEQRIVLAPMQEVDLRFTALEADLEKRGHRFVLRMWGYYELLPSASERSP